MKPENLLVDGETGYVKITDFGVSSYQGGGGETFGTPAFHGPEIIQSSRQKMQQKRLGPAVDIWALGCTIFMLIYGCPPFMQSNLRGGILALNERILKDDVSFPEMFPVSPTFKKMICSMLIKDPSKRATLAEIRCDSWLTNGELSPLPVVNYVHLQVTKQEETHAVAGLLLPSIVSSVVKLKKLAKETKEKLFLKREADADMQLDLRLLSPEGTQSANFPRAQLAVKNSGVVSMNSFLCTTKSYSDLNEGDQLTAANVAGHGGPCVPGDADQISVEEEYSDVGSNYRGSESSEYSDNAVTMDGLTSLFAPLLVSELNNDEGTFALSPGAMELTNFESSLHTPWKYAVALNQVRIAFNTAQCVSCRDCVYSCGLVWYVKASVLS